MNKTVRFSGKLILGIIFLIIILLLTVPLFFKGKIKDTLVNAINGSVNAKVGFTDYKLGFFRNFPNITFSLENLSVTGVGKFEDDTLAAIKTANIIFNLSSLFKKSGYEIRSVKIDRAGVRTIVLEDGSANWEIMKEQDSDQDDDGSSSGMKILLREVKAINSSLSYTDHSLLLETRLDNLNLALRGDLTMSETNLEILLDAGDVNLKMDGIRYLNRAIAESRINLQANLDSMVFYLMENYLTVNDLKLNFAGMFAMPDDDIVTDITFYTDDTNFKTLLSLIPSVFMKDYEELNTSGEFSLQGSAKGVYSDADSTLPDFSLDLKINNGLISYPMLPGRITNINVWSDLFIDGRDIDRSVVNIEKLHMELAGNPFDMAFTMKTPVSDPDIKASAIGKIDLDALAKAFPLDSINMSGIIDMSVSFAGKLSAIKKEQYNSFNASGNVIIENMILGVSGYPEVSIHSAGLGITPAYADLREASIKVGKKSDFILTGKLGNYIPYVFDDEVLRGNLTLSSTLVDMDEIMSGVLPDTATADTTSLSLIKVPENIDFDFNARVENFIYKNIKARNVTGHLIAKDGTLRIKDTGMDLLGGKVSMNAFYDTRDLTKPEVTTELSIENIGLKEAFSTFNTVRSLAPAAGGMDGKFTMKFSYRSLLANNLMPVIQTISGSGRIISDEITLVESLTFDKMKEVLKLGKQYSNTFRDLNISFKINEGRVYVSPFDTKAGNIRLNISGDQGLDQTLHYIVKTEIPRSELGGSVNALVDNLTSRAAGLGFVYKPSDVIRVNLQVAGTFRQPVVTPFFGDSSSDSGTAVRETVAGTVSDVVDTASVRLRDKARSEAEARGDKLVREAEEKAQQIRDEAEKAAEKVRNEASERADKLIREAESKGAIAKVAAQKAADGIRKEGENRARQIIDEGNEKADLLIEEAKAGKDELVNKL